MVTTTYIVQEEYIQTKPARDAAAKAKMEAEASAAREGPLHLENEWNIRYFILVSNLNNLLQS